jgi:hypothetical protein
VPWSLIFHHAIEYDEELAHAGGHGDFMRLACLKRRFRHDDSPSLANDSGSWPKQLFGLNIKKGMMTSLTHGLEDPGENGLSCPRENNLNFIKIQEKSHGGNIQGE